MYAPVVVLCHALLCSAETQAEEEAQQQQEPTEEAAAGEGEAICAMLSSVLL